jgi:hypothetical protein
MKPLTPEQEVGLSRFVCDYFALKGKLIYPDKEVPFQRACFKVLSVLETSYRFDNADLIQFHFNDNLTHVLAGVVEVDAQEIEKEFVDDILEMCGLVTSLVTYEKNRIALTFNVREVSAREVFFIGNLIRTIQNWPAIVYDYLKLKTMYPNMEKWRLLYTAHLLFLGPYRAMSNNNHCHLDFYTMGYFKDSPKETLEEIRKEPWGTLADNRNFAVMENGQDASPLQTYLYKAVDVEYNSPVRNKWINFRREAYINDTIQTVINALQSEEALTSFLNSQEFISYSPTKGIW